MINIRYVTIFFVLIIWAAPSAGQNNVTNLNWNQTYTSEFKQIEDLEKRGQNRSAYTKAAELLDRAISERSIPGIIGSIDPLIRNMYHVDDDALTSLLEKIATLQSSHPVVNAVVNSYLAELLTGYLERNRYRISQVTEGNPLPWSNVNRWSASQIEATIDSLYAKSVQPEELKEISSNKLVSVMDQNDTEIGWELRPRLYDLLQERLINYLQNNRLHWYPSRQNPDQTLADLLLKEDLSDYLENQDPTQRFYSIFQAYDQWENSLIEPDFTEAYIEVVLKRISYTNNLLGEKFMQQSIPVLQSLIEKFSSAPNRLALDHEVAAVYYQKGDFVRALQTLNSALNQKPPKAYPHTIARMNEMIKSIKAPELYIQVEDAYTSDETPLVSIQFRNLDKVRLELYPITEKDFVELRFLNSRLEKDDFKLIQNKKPTWQKTVKFPKTTDFQSHRTEAAIDSKKTRGTYALRYWYKKDNVDISGLVLFQISDLTLINASDNSGQKLYVIDRETGSMIKGAKVEAISFTRNHLFQNKETRLILEDSPGSYILPDKLQNVYYKVTSGKDTYISPMTYHRNIREYPVGPQQKTTLLTDRSIYKPGQTIHFKALLTLSGRLDSEIVKGQKIDITLRNANGKEVWAKSLTTDEWGTVTGAVPIPMSGLKGNWSLQASPSGYARLLVEEYQRPNFELIVPDSAISRGDSLIQISGEARTYHGFPVQNGQGEVRVQLQQRHWFYRAPALESEVIYSGSFETNEDGTFSISWEGIDPSASKFRYGSFYFYSIHLSVQAASGEIRETTKEIPLDPEKKQIQIDFPTFQVLKEISPVRFSVKNALGNADSMEVKVQLDRLAAPEKYKVDRLWELPDKPFLDRSQFENKIGHIYYDHGAAMDKWATEKTLKSWTLHIADNDSLDIKSIINHTGYYRISITSTTGDSLTTHSFGLAESKAKDGIVHDAVEIVTSTNSAQPGETVELNFYTPKINHGGMIRIVFSDGTSHAYELDEKKTVKVKVEEKHRGGFFVHAFGYLANRFYSKSTFIEVPWKNKELKIEGPGNLSTLEVNQDTSLRISIVDNNGHGVKSEVAVAIYDASLDAYSPHSWAIAPGFFLNLTNPLHIYNVSGNLGVVIFSESNYWKDRVEVPPLIIPELPYLRIGYRNRHYFGDMMRSTQDVAEMAMPAPSMKSMNMATEESTASVLTIDDQSSKPQAVHLRDDFAETILFAGKVTTDSLGRVTIPFRTNDKSGRWKILVFAHSEDLKSGTLSHTFETTKEVFLESFLPEIVRQGDQIDLAFTLFNNTKNSVSGQVIFEIRSLFGDDKTRNYQKNLVFEVESGKSVVLTLPVPIQKDEKGPLIFTSRVVDEAGRIWDATEEVISVLPSTEIVFDGNVMVLGQGDSWKGDDFLRSSEAGNGQVTIRIVQNMYSELMKSIPYLQWDNPVTTDQFFRNGLQALLGQYLSGEIPGFDQIYAEWKRKGELESRLARNEDKKYVTLENSPWVRRSDSGTEQMALLGLFFDESHINQVVETNFAKWAESQNPDGGFPWIKDGESSFYITVRFLVQWEKMIWAGVPSTHFTDEMMQKARKYVDQEFLRMWKEMKEKSPSTYVSYNRFMSYFMQQAYHFDRGDKSGEYLTAWSELKDSIYSNWSHQTSESRAQIGIAAWHLGDKEVSNAVVEAFIDNAIRNTRLGTYWRYNNQHNQNGYLGILSGITELLILHENTELNEGIIQWVLVNKMTNDWQQNPHVSSLMLSLLKMSGDWTRLSKTQIVTREGEKTLTGLGDADEILINLEDLQSVRITHIDGPPIWVGVITHREVEPEDITEQSGNILQIKKIVTGVDQNDSIKTGDQVVIKLRITADRDLDYVFIEDPLIPGMDPGISLSGFRWQLGLSYYQTFNPSAAQFFIQHLPKGEYVLEYKLGVVRSGQFRHPATKVQSYFAPEINGLDQWKPLVEISK